MRDPAKEEPPFVEPRDLFRGAAEAAGLIRPGDPLDENVVQYALQIVERCASIADAYQVGDANAGEHIRAVLSHV